MTLADPPSADPSGHGSAGSKVPQPFQAAFFIGSRQCQIGRQTPRARFILTAPIFLANSCVD